MDFFNNITASILFLYVTVFTMLAYPGYLTSRVPSYMLTTSKMALWMHFSSAAGVIYTIIFLILTLSYEVQHLALEKSSASLNTC